MLDMGVVKSVPRKGSESIMAKDTIKSVVVDDVDMMRATLKKVLDGFPNIEIIGEASDYESAREVINETKPDLVFLDIDLNGLTSIDLLNEINCSPKIIFITSHPDFAIKACGLYFKTYQQ
jgi:two-component system LytT family response regulator